MDRPELREKIIEAIDLLFKKENCGYSQYEMNVCADQILIPVDAEIRGILEELKAIPNPYAEDIFPRDHKWAGKIMRDKGLTDDEITGISGAVGRLAFLHIMKEIEELESKYLKGE